MVFAVPGNAPGLASSRWAVPAARSTCGARRGALARHIEERAGTVEFAGTEQPDAAVLPVVSGILDDLAPAQPGYRFGEWRPADAGQLLRRHVPQDRQFRPESSHQPVNDGVYALALRPHREDLANDFRERDEIIEASGAIRPVAIGAVSEFRDPVQDPDGKWFMTLGADPVTLASLLGLEPDPALTVPVQVILTLFRIELDRAG